MNREYTRVVEQKIFVKLAIISLLLTGCGSGSNDNQNSEVNTALESIKLSENIWTPQQCEIDDEAKEYHKLLYQFAINGSAKLGRQYYKDSDCTIKGERVLPIDVGWRYTESDPMTLEDGIQGVGISFDKSGKVVDGYYAISESNLLCFSYNLAFLQSGTDESSSTAIDYDHCLRLEVDSEIEEDDTMINQEKLVWNYLKEEGWPMDTATVRSNNNIDIPNCSFFYADKNIELDSVASTIGITSKSQIITMFDPEVVSKVLSVIPDVNSVTAENWAELLTRFSPKLGPGSICLESCYGYPTKFEDAGVEFVAPELTNTNSGFSLHFFMEEYETSAVYEVFIDIENGFIKEAEMKFVFE
ncbi:MAG: hypothetical protein P8179_08835 [Candidatus Thiodiazotropha sp.]|jgi:hypothetical protein